ncbi:hypothetical protein K2X85_15965 [bacterium]|nr:hypothetical protein [bacterium]
MNLYRYVSNSTPNFTDPTGLAASGFISNVPTNPFGSGNLPTMTLDGAGPQASMPNYPQTDPFGHGPVSTVTTNSSGIPGMLSFIRSGWIPSWRDLIGFIPGYGDAIETAACIYEGVYVTVIGAMLPGPNIWRYLKAISPYDIKFLDSIGKDPHSLKRSFGVGVKQDVFKDCNGNLFLGNKNRTGEFKDLGENIDELREQRHG